MTHDRIAIAYAKSSTEPERRGLAHLLGLVTELRSAEQNFREQWRLLRADPPSEATRSMLAHLRAQPKSERSAPLELTRKNPGKDYLCLFDILEAEYERLRSECTVVEVVKSALDGARGDMGSFLEQNNGAPAALNEALAGVRVQHEGLVLALEDFLARNAG